MNVREFLEETAVSDDLTTINKPVNVKYELANVAHALEGRVVLFEQIEEYPEWRVVAGLCADRRYFGMNLGIPASDLLERLVDALANPIANPIVENAPCQEVVRENVNLNDLPIPLHLPQDAGHYVASGVAIINDPDDGPNMCYHRLLRLNETEFTARIIERRGTHTAMQKVDGDLPIAICIGVPQAVHLAASMSPDSTVSELAIANALAPTPLVKCKTSDIYVPAQAEIVLEGRITKRMTGEGPFMDLTETMDIVRQQPIIEIDCITHRRDPIFHALLPGGLEHKLLMGMPREPTIVAQVNKVAECRAALITPGGASWLHAVVQIKKRAAGDGKRAIEAAFAGHGSLKHVWVVDEDVDLHDPAQVEWAMATRFQADKDLVVMEGAAGSSLDPSGTHVAGQKSVTTKAGFDCTVPWGGKGEKFSKGAYGAVDLAEWVNN